MNRSQVKRSISFT